MHPPLPGELANVEWLRHLLCSERPNSKSKLACLTKSSLSLNFHSCPIHGVGLKFISDNVRKAGAQKILLHRPGRVLGARTHMPLADGVTCGG